MLDIADRAHAGHAIRSFNFTEFEFRDDGPTGLTFEGVASVVDTPYEVRDTWGTFTETIRAGAFNKTLKDGKADVALFVNHDTRALPLATRLDGSLVLAANPHLSVRATLNPARPSVQEVRHAVADGQARQMSIGFGVPKDAQKDVWNADYTERTIHEVKLNETSIVWRGASPTTSGAMRSLDEFLTAGDMTEAEMRSLIRRMETRFADIYMDDVRSRLRSALEARYAPTQNQWLWVRDFSDIEVVYELEGFASPGCFALGYSLDPAGAVVLSDNPVAVVPSTTYVPTAARSAFEARDLADRERLEMKSAMRPAPIA